MTDLQRCPNCGGPPKLHQKKNRFWYECDGDCWTQTDKRSTPEAAAAEWNALKPREKCQEAEEPEYVIIPLSAWREFYNELTSSLEPYDQYDTGYRDALDRVDDWLDTLKSDETTH